MAKKYLTILCFVLFSSVKGISQDSIVRCNTYANMSLLQTYSPDIYQNFLDIETFTANYINNQNQTNGRLINGGGLIVIPVVVHVLHHGEPEGTGLNISMATIQSQIDVLNEDYRRLNADAVNTPSIFQSSAGDFGIEFRLACIDPNGNATTGVVRKQTSISQFTPSARADDSYDDDAIGIKKEPNGSAAWSTDKYLNIWVTNIAGVAGYSTFPALYSRYPQFDGVVIDRAAFGRVGGTRTGFDKGRTATHEIGHWLNLRHMWGNIKAPLYNSACTDDDFVGDTPKQKYPNNNCRTFPEPIYLCNAADVSTMFMNYMDYVPDNCYNLFTNGQKLRARALFVTGGPRSTFLNNYFQIQQPIPGLSCSGGTVKLFNPTCAIPTWSIISGAATITGGQNTNNCILSTPTVGTIIIRATAGNYIDERTIQVVPYTSSDYILTANNTNTPYLYHCTNQTITFTVTGANGIAVPTGSNFTWTLPNTSWTMVYNGGSNYIAARSPSSSYPPTGNITVSFNEPCGALVTKSMFLAYSPNACNGTDPRYTYSPNPAPTSLNVSVASGYIGSVFIRKIQLVSNNFGTTVYNQDYSLSNVSNTTIPMTSFPIGTYTLRIYDGSNWSTYSILH
jgi:Pregnancy-associated plasma protein-A